MPPRTILTRCCSCSASSARSTSAAPTAIGPRRPQGLGRADRHAFDPAGPAVRRHQGQERDRHADGDRGDGPAVRRPGRRLRDHVERQRLPAAGDADQAGRPARLRLRHRRAPHRFQQACSRFIDVAALASEEDEALDRPRPAGQREVDAELLTGARRRIQGLEARREGYASLSEVGQRAKAVSTSPCATTAHAACRSDQGGAQFRRQDRAPTAPFLVEAPSLQGAFSAKEAAPALPF